MWAKTARHLINDLGAARLRRSWLSSVNVFTGCLRPVKEDMVAILMLVGKTEFGWESEWSRTKC